MSTGDCGAVVMMPPARWRIMLPPRKFRFGAVARQSGLVGRRVGSRPGSAAEPGSANHLLSGFCSGVLGAPAPCGVGVGVGVGVAVGQGGERTVGQFAKLPDGVVERTAGQARVTCARRSDGRESCSFIRRRCVRFSTAGRN